DSASVELSAQRKQGLSEDEVDDLIHDFAYRTTSIGRAAIESMDPRRRFEGFAAEFPELVEASLEVLAFLGKRRSMAAIDSLFRHATLLQENGRDGRPLQPSVLVDKLEQSGCIYWNNGWIISKGGERVVTEQEISRTGKERRKEK
ncbi:MAG: hypothetical protein LBJ48_04160, partial [Coriobacteriales bacterium]|nr:hypothetical protein [Coriobacteriales bacterium]